MKPDVEPVSDETHEVSVRALAAGGSGVAELPDGRVVFVPRTAPGDQARVRVTKSKARWATAEVVEITSASPDRQAPPCRLYARCGGCQLQHLPYEEQLAWKGRFVSDALGRIGGLADIEPPRVVASPDELRYRDRMTFTLRRLGGGRVVAGLHALGRPAHVVDIGQECLLPRTELSAGWARLRAGWGDGARWLPGAGRLRLTLRSAAEDRLELVVEGGDGSWDALPLLESVSGLTAIWHQPSGGGARPALVAGQAEPGGGRAFAQANASCAELLRAYVLRLAAERAEVPGRAIDAYCGTGVYARALAAEGWGVTGIEVDEDAATSASGDGVDVLVGRVEDRLADALPAELLVLNPPRTGLHPDVAARILADPPSTVIYVSCDPATLARDLGALSTGYGVEAIECFDLFPQTAHVETVVLLGARMEGR